MISLPLHPTHGTVVNGSYLRNVSIGYQPCPRCSSSRKTCSCVSKHLPRGDLHVQIETPTAQSAGGVLIRTSNSFYWMNIEDKVDIRLTHRIATLTVH